MSLGPYLNYDGEDYECLICRRYFPNRGALYAHCKYTSRHEWCDRCHRVFVSGAAFEAHLRASSSHNPCPSCPQKPDFVSKAALREHVDLTHFRCGLCPCVAASRGLLQAHERKEHHVCDDCGAVFAIENNLRMVWFLFSLIDTLQIP